MSKPESYLEAIRLQRIQIRELTVCIESCVAAARNAGSTWQEISTALAITKQAAQQHYGPKSHWTAADTAAGQTPSMFSHNGK